MRLVQSLDAALHRWLLDHSIGLLRIVVGVIFLIFGVLKYFPGVSPAEGLTIKTTDALTFGLLPGEIAIVLIATLECIIGLLLIAGRWLRVAIYLLAGQLIGILAPLALFTGRLFDGPHNAPTLEGQYVIKDFILVAAGFVVASTLPGLVPGADPATARRDRRSRPRTDWSDRSLQHT